LPSRSLEKTIWSDISPTTKGLKLFNRATRIGFGGIAGSGGTVRFINNPLSPCNILKLARIAGVIGGPAGSNVFKSKLMVIGPVDIAVVEMSKASFRKMLKPAGVEGIMGFGGIRGLTDVFPGRDTFEKTTVIPPSWTLTFEPAGVIGGHLGSIDPARWVRSEKQRRGGNPAVEYSQIQEEVMTVYSYSPTIILAGAPEKSHVIEVRTEDLHKSVLAIWFKTGSSLLIPVAFR
jgi:hypothetical protein